jgi:glycerophosphoryl diester phosphodiesterase
MGHAPENTLASFSKAMELGAHCVELDVYFVEDQLVVFHDDHLDRTTNGQGLLMDKSLAFLRSLDAGQGEKIPTLREVCDLLDARVGINIELKGPGTAGPVVHFTHSLLSAGWKPAQILVSSFDHDQLQQCRELDGEMKLGVLFNGPISNHLEFAKKIKATALHPSLQNTDAALVGAAHRGGFKVLVFTVNSDADIARMAKLGVDGIFTNYPDKVSEFAKSGLVPLPW